MDSNQFDKKTQNWNEFDKVCLNVSSLIFQFATRFESIKIIESKKLFG